MNDNLDVEVFRAGDYGEKGRWSEDHLDQIVADYDPALHEAPVTLDHARGGPALGWVAALRRVGDRLVASLRGLNVKLLELLRGGSFKKRSVEIYPTLRETGRPYLRAVSFLGAAVPEVKGLADPPLFEEGEEAGLVFEEEAGNEIERTDATDATDGTDEKIILNSETLQNSAELPKTNDSHEAIEGEHVLLFEHLAARLRESGKWRPAWAELGIADFYRAIAGLGAIEFSDERSLSPAAWFGEFLERLPPLVAMGEAAPAGDGALAGLAGGSVPVDPASLRLHQNALAWQQSNPGTSYSDALLRCAGKS